MTADDAPVETGVNNQGVVTTPAEIRHRLRIDSGDKFRWNIADGGELTVDIIHQREGVFDDFESIEAGPTDAVDVEREFGNE